MPRIALALGGGAALGFAHVGVLRVLAEAGVEIGAVAGTSIGAIAAAALAADRLEAFEAIARGAHLGRVAGYLDPLLGRGAVLGGRRIRRELDAEFGDRSIEALPIPSCFVAADLRTGEEVRLTRGAVVPAVQASIAIPTLFAPVRHEGRLLIDGGMVAPLPLAAARAVGSGLPLVGVDLMDDFAGHIAAVMPGQPDRSPSAFRVGRSAFLMLMRQLTRQTIAIERPAMVIAPRIGHIGTAGFASGGDLIRLGAEAAEAALPRLLALTGASPAAAGA